MCQVEPSENHGSVGNWYNLIGERCMLEQVCAVPTHTEGEDRREGKSPGHRMRKPSEEEWYLARYMTKVRVLTLGPQRATSIKNFSFLKAGDLICFVFS